MEVKAEDLEIARLGPCVYPSPLEQISRDRFCQFVFVPEDMKILFDPEVDLIQKYKDAGEPLPMMEQAGPRAMNYFDPAKVKAALVTCGGLCPGINDVIRGIVMELFYRYGTKDIFGVRYGYQGFVPEYGYPMIPLTPDMVNDIHSRGGTFLGSSRGQQDCGKIVDRLQREGINMLFVIGGDGTLRAALEISKIARQRNLNISVIGIPKTIDNDILYIDKSFGFESAFSEAVMSIACANEEAEGAPNCVGLVRLMGRDSGFISCFAALAMTHLNYVFIPEIPFEFDGPGGFLQHLKERLARKHHAVIVVAEGAGQEYLEDGKVEKDASGNVKYRDIGLYMKDRIFRYFKEQNLDVSVKYIDPSYMIRSIPANPSDGVYCSYLARHAVHAAMSGRTEMVVGLRNNKYVYLPMSLIARGRKRVDPNGGLWYSVLETTGQPPRFGE